MVLRGIEKVTKKGILKWVEIKLVLENSRPTFSPRFYRWEGDIKQHDYGGM